MKWPSDSLIGTLIGTILGRLLLGLPHGITISAQVRSFVKKPLFFMGLQMLWAVFYGSGDDQNHFFESQTPLDDKAAPHRSRPIMSR
jgi:hypothetical protein